MVVDKADTAECLCKEDLLCRSWIESEFAGFIDLSIEPVVVDKADTAECLCKEDLLCRSWIESEFAGFIWHIVSSSLSLIL